MHPDLALLVDLQRIDSAIAACRKALADVPAREAALDAKLAAATTARDAARQRVADNRTARGAVERDLAVVQGRLSRFKDQTMAVKTNKEFHALQHEIATAQEEIQKFEDRVLELMMEADDLAGALKGAERALVETEREAQDGRRQVADDKARLDRELARHQEERDALVARLPRQALGLYSSASRHGGLAVTAMRDGHCGVCHVRLRPQVAQAAHANESILVCENCGRILYLEPRPSPEA